MTIDLITNLEPGSSVREKLNELIDLFNTSLAGGAVISSKVAANGDPEEGLRIPGDNGGNAISQILLDATGQGNRSLTIEPSASGINFISENLNNQVARDFQFFAGPELVLHLGIDGDPWQIGASTTVYGNATGVGIGVEVPEYELDLRSGSDTVLHIGAQKFFASSSINASILFSNPAYETNLEIGRAQIAAMGTGSSTGSSIMWFNVADGGLTGIDSDTTAKAHAGGIRLDSAGSLQYWQSDTLLLSVDDTDLVYDGNAVWHSGNDGSNSGLNADKLDGQHGGYYLDATNFTDLQSLTSIVESTSYIGVGVAGGGVTINTNDGGGNANVTFNHQGETPGQNGNSGRISVNTDSTTDAAMEFSLGENVTGGNSIVLPTLMSISPAGTTLFGPDNLVLTLKSTQANRSARIDLHGNLSGTVALRGSIFSDQTVGDMTIAADPDGNSGFGQVHLQKASIRTFTFDANDLNMWVAGQSDVNGTFTMVGWRESGGQLVNTIVSDNVGNGSNLVSSIEFQTQGTVGGQRLQLNVISTDGLSLRSFRFDTDNTFRALDDNVGDLGSGSQRWGTVYAATGSINTSDLNVKQDVAAMSAAEIQAAKVISQAVKTYRFKDAVALKGTAARTHIGYIAQTIRDALIAEGLDPWIYGFLCSDTIYVDVNGKVLDTGDGVPAGAVAQERLSLRYDELQAFINAGFEARLEALEQV